MLSCAVLLREQELMQYHSNLRNWLLVYCDRKERQRTEDHNDLDLVWKRIEACLGGSADSQQQESVPGKVGLPGEAFRPKPNRPEASDTWTEIISVLSDRLPV